MRFQEHLFWAYNSKRQVVNIKEILLGFLSSDAPFALGGLDDLMNSLMIVEEWYDAHCPHIEFSEAEVTDPDLYRESPSSGVARTILIPAHIDEGKRARRHEKAGEVIKQDLVIYFTPMSLMRRDWYPKTGDTFWYRDMKRQITTVKHDPESYWGHTAFPLHVTCFTAPHQPEFDLVGGLGCDKEKSANEPLPLPPSEDVEDPISISPYDAGNSVITETVEEEEDGCDCPVKTVSCYDRTCHFYDNRGG